jgi:hypothetical protein
MGLRVDERLKVHVHLTPEEEEEEEKKNTSHVNASPPHHGSIIMRVAKHYASKIVPTFVRTCCIGAKEFVSRPNAGALN